MSYGKKNNARRNNCKSKTNERKKKEKKKELKREKEIRENMKYPKGKATTSKREALMKFQIVSTIAHASRAERPSLRGTKQASGRA